MRILWVKIGGLVPVDTGGRRRTFQTLTELSKRHEVVLLTTHAPGERQRLLREALPGCAEIVSVPHVIPKKGSRGFAQALVRSWFSTLPVDLLRCRVACVHEAITCLLRARHFDLVVADFLAAMPSLPDDLEVPVVLFQHNVEHQIWRRLRDSESVLWRRLLLELEWRKLRRYEALACARVRRTITVSENDRVQLAKLAPGADIVSIPTGVDTSYFAPQLVPQEAHGLVFTGAMDWFPNEDGIVRFIETTLPLVRKAVPDTTLTVVGRNPTSRLRAVAEAAHVTITGTVDDVRPPLARGAVCVVPLRIGGGTRLKIFEALSMAKAVVSTTIGAEGLPVVPGEHLLISDEPEAFAAAVVGLLRAPERARALGAAGRKLVEWEFAWPQVATRFEQHLTEVNGHAH